MGNRTNCFSTTFFENQKAWTEHPLEYSNYSNSTAQSTENEYNMPAWVMAQLSFLFIISTLGSLENSIVVLVVVHKRRMQNFTNWLILNLSVADLAVSVFCIPLEIPLIMNNYEWIYGTVICPVLYPMETVIIYVSVFTLVAMSLSRYWALLHPFKKQPSVRHAKYAMCIIWLASVAFVIPYTISLKYHAETKSCAETFSKKQVRNYTLAIFIFQYALPLTVISISYLLVCWELKRKSNGEMEVPVHRVRREESKQVVKMLVIVTITFAICVLPYHLVYLYNDYIHENFQSKEILAGFAYVLLYMNSVLNPIVYNAFNENFREALRELMRTVKAFLVCKSETLGDEGFFSPRRSSLHPASNSARPSRIDQEMPRKELRTPSNGSCSLNAFSGDDVHVPLVQYICRGASEY